MLKLGDTEDGVMLRRAMFRARVMLGVRGCMGWCDILEAQGQGDAQDRGMLKLGGAGHGAILVVGAMLGVGVTLRKVRCSSWEIQGTG